MARKKSAQPLCAEPSQRSAAELVHALFPAALDVEMRSREFIARGLAPDAHPAQGQILFRAREPLDVQTVGTEPRPTQEGRREFYVVRIDNALVYLRIEFNVDGRPGSGASALATGPLPVRDPAEQTQMLRWAEGRFKDLQEDWDAALA